MNRTASRHAFAALLATGAALLNAPDVHAEPSPEPPPTAIPAPETAAGTSPDATAPPPERAIRITPSGQILARFRHEEGRDFEPGGVTRTVRQRARAGLKFELDRVSVVIEAQDVRAWGDATDTLWDYSADGFDLHQGFVQVALADGLNLRVGRQAIDWLNQRLIGSVPWIEQARTLDAARLSYASADGTMEADLFYARGRHAIVEGDPRPEDVIAGLWRYSLHPAFNPTLLAIVDLNGPMDRVRVTSGLYATGRFPFGLSYVLEAYHQGGRATTGVDISAFLTALRVRYTLPDNPMAPYVELRGEVVSGDGDPSDGTVRSFDTLFATNHIFYGEMDFFLNLPAHTGQRGLVDLGGKAGLAPHPNVDVSAAVHVFHAHRPRGGPSLFGTEVDLRTEWRPIERLRFDLVYAVLFPGDAFTGGSPTAGPEHFVYSTVQTVF